MSHRAMNESHALLIRSEAEWLNLNHSLAEMLECLHCGCTLSRWDAAGCKAKHPEKLCPLGVLSDPETSPPHMRRRTARPVRTDMNFSRQAGS
jgi:hypothetical protein